MFSLSLCDSDTRATVPSRRALAQALGCTEKIVSVMLIEPGNPGTKPNGSYPLQAWKTFFEERKKRRAEEKENADGLSLSGGSADERAELRAAVLRERRAKAEKAELEAARLRGELVPAAEVEKSVTDFCSRLKGIHHRSATTDAVNELATALALDSEQTGKLLVYMEKFHDRFCAEVANGN